MFRTNNNNNMMKIASFAGDAILSPFLTMSSFKDLSYYYTSRSIVSYFNDQFGNWFVIFRPKRFSFSVLPILADGTHVRFLKVALMTVKYILSLFGFCDFRIHRIVARLILKVRI
jgi:hypothetical protein